jgi:hypothetical protein
MTVALLTAAGSGIGAATARELRAQGWEVAILSPSGRGAALAEELGGLGVTGSQRVRGGPPPPRGRGRRALGAGRRSGELGGARAARLGARALGCGLAQGDGGLLPQRRAAHPACAPAYGAAGRGQHRQRQSYVAEEPSALDPTSSSMRAGLAAWVKIVSDEVGPQGASASTTSCPASSTPSPAARTHRRASLAPHGPNRGGGQDHRLPLLGGGGLHHRPEHPRRWRPARST